jgi:hypothetical protein
MNYYIASSSCAYAVMFPELWRRMRTDLLWESVCRSPVGQPLSQDSSLGEHDLPCLAAQVGRSRRVRALAHYEPGPTVVVVR